MSPLSISNLKNRATFISINIRWIIADILAEEITQLLEQLWYVLVNLIVPDVDQQRGGDKHS